MLKNTKASVGGYLLKNTEARLRRLYAKKHQRYNRYMLKNTEAII